MTSGGQGCKTMADCNIDINFGGFCTIGIDVNLSKFALLMMGEKHEKYY